MMMDKCQLYMGEILKQKVRSCNACIRKFREWKTETEKRENKWSENVQEKTTSQKNRDERRGETRRGEKRLDAPL